MAFVSLAQFYTEHHDTSLHYVVNVKLGLTSTKYWLA